MLLEGSSFHLVTDDLAAPMDSRRNQRTIAAPVEVQGFGYWSGQDVLVEFRPAEEQTGVVFVRRDLPGRPRIRACPENWLEIPRRTSLRHANASVEMVEHILAALVGLRIDNCEVWVDAAEMPGCDGSAQPFVEALQSAGIVGQAAPRPRRVIRELLRLGTADCWIEVRPPKARGTFLNYHLDYGPHSPIGRQTLELPLTPESFVGQLAASRTFMLQEEAEWLRAQGLGRRVTAGDLLVFGPHGPIDNRLRFADECVRHKLLDLVGDLGLAACDLVGQFTAYRSGHRHNAEMVRTLLSKTELRRGWQRCA